MDMVHPPTQVQISMGKKLQDFKSVSELWICKNLKLSPSQDNQSVQPQIQ